MSFWSYHGCNDDYIENVNKAQLRSLKTIAAPKHKMFFKWAKTGNFFFLKQWAIPGLFFFIFVFSIQLTVNNVQYNFLPMTGFEPRTFGIGSNRSTN